MLTRNPAKSKFSTETLDVKPVDNGQGTSASAGEGSVGEAAEAAADKKQAPFYSLSVIERAERNAHVPEPIKERKKEVFSCYLEVSVVERLDVLAKKLERTRAWLMNKAIIEYLEAHEES